MLPRFLRVELLRERVELGVPFLQCSLFRRRETVRVTRMPVRAARLVDVDVVAVAIRGEEPDAELVEQRMDARLVGRYPLASKLVRLAADLRVPEPSADTVPGFEDGDVTSRGDQVSRSGETCHSRSDDREVGLDQAGAHASLLSAAAAAARPVRTAPSMYPAAHWSDPQT